MRLELLAEFRRVFPFSWYAWLLTDPQTAVGCAPLADVPCLPELPTLIRLKYQTTVNRWTDLARPVGLLSEVDDPSRSAVWHRLQSRFGFVDVASVVFRDQFGIWSFLDLWRHARAGRFRAKGGRLPKRAGRARHRRVPPLRGHDVRRAGR